MNDLLACADAVIAGKSRSYVDDAKDLAVAYRELVTHHASYCISPETYLALEKRFKVAEAALANVVSRAAVELGGARTYAEIHEIAGDALLAIEEESDPPPVANYKEALATLDAAQAAGSALTIEVQELRAENRRLKEALVKLAAAPSEEDVSAWATLLDLRDDVENGFNDIRSMFKQLAIVVENVSRPTRVCGFETARGEFCNLPAPRWFYEYANGKTIDLCAQHAREMRGSKERE